MMGRTPEETAVLERFAQQYLLSQTSVLRGIERDVCGCDYGGTSWATKDEAEEVAEAVGLTGSNRLLELGAGSGWPGLYLAAKIGCRTALVDIPFQGLRIAAGRANADGMSAKVWVLAADGAVLPFADQSFDAITHSDVLCCLQSKSAVLTECRRLSRSGGRMVFSVISIAAALTPAEAERADAAGPPFKIVSTGYPAMLEASGWLTLRSTDVTDTYSASVDRRLSEEETNANALIPLLGDEGFEDMIARRRRTAQAIDDGLLRREFFVTVADL